MSGKLAPDVDTQTPRARFTCVPSGPFTLSAAQDYFGGWVSTGPDPSALAMAFPVEGWRASAAVVRRQDGAGSVRGKVALIGAAADEEHDRAWRQALAVLSLDADGAGWPAVGQRDPVIGALQQRYSWLRPVLFHSPYEAAAAFIIGHRISMLQGRALRQVMARELGDALPAGGTTVYAFPRPHVLCELSSFPGLSAQKIERLHAIAHAALDGLLDRAYLRSLPVEQALQQLQTLPGIGPFFSQGILLRGAGLVDMLSDDDVTSEAMQRAYTLPQPPDLPAALRLADAWRPYCAWASVLLHVWLRREAGGPHGQARARSRSVSDAPPRAAPTR
jgi:DNA-3-methyladenine glycosylase II